MMVENPLIAKAKAGTQNIAAPPAASGMGAAMAPVAAPFSNSAPQKPTAAMLHPMAAASPVAPTPAPAAPAAPPQAAPAASAPVLAAPATDQARAQATARLSQHAAQLGIAPEALHAQIIARAEQALRGVTGFTAPNGAGMGAAMQRIASEMPQRRNY